MEASIAMKNISMVYGGHVEALRSVHLTVEPGEFVSLIGPSGCGKTTMLRLMAGLEKPTQGKVSILGGPPAEASRQGRLGIAFQQPALVESRTARGNVQLTLEITKAQPKHSVEALLEQFGIGDFMDRFPHELSGGMKQRVNIACALVHNPGILLLDEPFGALDELTRELLGEWLSGILREGKQTGVLITHSVDEAVMLSDRLVLLSPRPGRIAEIVDIPFEQPRKRTLRTDETFLKLVSQVREKLYAVTAETVA